MSTKIEKSPLANRVRTVTSKQQTCKRRTFSKAKRDAFLSMLGTFRLLYDDRNYTEAAFVLRSAVAMACVWRMQKRSKVTCTMTSAEQLVPKALSFNAISKDENKILLKFARSLRPSRDKFLKTYRWCLQFANEVKS